MALTIVALAPAAVLTQIIGGREAMMLRPFWGYFALFVYSVAFGAAIWIARPSGIVTVLRNPNGLPSFAGRNITLTLSPACRAFGPVLPIPRCARAVAEPSVITQSVIVPSGFLTVRVSDPWGLENLILATVPSIFVSFFMSYTPARE